MPIKILPFWQKVSDIPKSFITLNHSSAHRDRKVLG
jgi:hypothetical protein